MSDYDPIPEQELSDQLDKAYRALFLPEGPTEFSGSLLTDGHTLEVLTKNWADEFPKDAQLSEIVRILRAPEAPTNILTQSLFYEKSKHYRPDSGAVKAILAGRVDGRENLFVIRYAEAEGKKRFVVDQYAVTERFVAIQIVEGEDADDIGARRRFKKVIDSAILSAHGLSEQSSDGSFAFPLSTRDCPLQERKIGDRSLPYEIRIERNDKVGIALPKKRELVIESKSPQV